MPAIEDEDDISYLLRMIEGASDASSYEADAAAIIRRLQTELASERERREKALKALDFDGSRYAGDNLLGVLIDLRHAGADVVCLRTIDRVMGQIAEVCAALSKEPAQLNVFPALKDGDFPSGSQTFLADT